MRNIPLSLFGCLMALVVIFPVTASAEEGVFKVGVFGEYTDTYFLEQPQNFYGTIPGVLAGYEKSMDDFWFSLDARFSEGRESSAESRWDKSRADFRGVIGKKLRFDFATIIPFAGVGVDSVTFDYRGGGWETLTNFLIPVGIKAQKEITGGTIGCDIQYALDVWRQDESSDQSQNIGIDGSSQLEFGISYEPDALPIGIRPYVRYEKWASTLTRPTEFKTVGCELYYKF